MSRIEGKIRRIFVFILTIFLVSSIFSTAFSKPAKSEQPPVEDFVVSDNEENDAEDGAEQKKKPSGEASDEEEESDEDEEEHEPTEEELAAAAAALNKKTEKLVEEVKKIGDNSAGIIECLTKAENSEALDNSNELLETLLDALLKEKKLNYSQLETYGQRLCNKDRKSSIGNYALGLGLMNKKKPNLKKAMDCLNIAKSAKKPHPGASSAYTSCLLKRFGLYIGLGVVAVIAIPIVVIIVIKKKKKKAAELEAANTENAEGEPNLDLQKLLDEGKELTDAANQAVASGDNLEQKPAENTEQKQNPLEKALEENKNVAPTPNAAPVANSNTASAKTETAEVKTTQPSEAVSASAANTQVTDNSSQATSTAPKKVVRVVKKVRVRKDADGNSYIVSESSSNQNVSEPVYQESTQRKADLEAVRSIVRPTEKPLPPVDTQLDILWGNLSRKAMQGHIGLMARKSDSLTSSLAPTTGGGGPVYGGGYSSDNRVTDIRLGDVSIDLSEEALKDDLVGKLKMLAITDSELRELFAMKNPAHIPHLIEYIMTKPEPMRLAFVAKEIGNYGDPAVVDTLASLLYHEDERVVLAAIQGLEATKSPAAVIPLCPFLRSEIPLYAQAARTALSKFGAVKIMQALKDLPTFTDIKIKEAGIFVLSRMKGDPVEKILKALLNDESSSVRIQAILAMSYQKNPVYIDPLREFYRIANETEKSMTRKAIVYLNGFNK